MVQLLPAAVIAIGIPVLLPMRSGKYEYDVSMNIAWNKQELKIMIWVAASPVRVRLTFRTVAPPDYTLQ